MADATITTEFTITGSYADADKEKARNMAFKALIDAIIAAPPAGWVYVSSTIPDPTTSQLAYDVIFTVNGTYRIKLSGSTNATYIGDLYIDVLTTAGVTLINSNTAYIPTVMTYTGAFTYNMSVTITSYVLADRYAVYVIGNTSTQELRSFGLIYMASKVAASEDPICFNSSHVTTKSFANTVSGTEYEICCFPNYMTYVTGEYALSDGYLYVDSTKMYNGNLYNCRFAGANRSTEIFTEGLIYVINSVTYLYIMYWGAFLKLST
jgi:hypothetical protein